MNRLQPAQQAGSERQPASQQRYPHPGVGSLNPTHCRCWEEIDAGQSRHRSASPPPLPLTCNPFIPWPLFPSPFGWYVSHHRSLFFPRGQTHLTQSSELHPTPTSPDRIQWVLAGWARKGKGTLEGTRLPLALKPTQSGVCK